MYENVVKPNEYTPIADLNQYLDDWQIKARVMTKENIKLFSNGKGERFIFELCDSHGTMI